MTCAVLDSLGSIIANDSFLNRLWDMAVNIIEVTSDDGYGADARERNLGFNVYRKIQVIGQPATP